MEDTHLKLILTVEDDTIDTDDYKYDYPENNVCKFCGSKCKNMYITHVYHDQVKTKCCYLCHTVLNLKKYHLGKIFLAVSKKSQKMINGRTLDHYYNYKTIPEYTEIDPHAKVLAINPYLFVKYSKNIYPEIEQELEGKNIVLFFTGELLKILSPKESCMFVEKKEMKSTYSPLQIKKTKKSLSVKINSLIEKNISSFIDNLTEKKTESSPKDNLEKKMKILKEKAKICEKIQKSLQK